jgi:hypothetical protein
VKAQRWLASLWVTSPSLTLVGMTMIFDLAACLLAMIFDSRKITGVNAWLKPAKFGLSSAVICLSLAWIAIYLRDWPKIRDWSGRMFAASIGIEIVIIDLQAVRGTTSHFNVATPFDRAAFVVMGLSICTLRLSMASTTYALMVQKIKPPSWAWSPRLGLLFSLLELLVAVLCCGKRRSRDISQPQRFGAHNVGWC